MKNYYTILGISEKADMATIKKAYRKLAFEFHPDKNSDKNAPEKFRQITEAYETLRNRDKKNEFDRILNARKHQSQSTSYSGQYEAKFQQWEKHGKKKSEEYGAMEYDDFIGKVFDEVKIGASYLPNIFTIGLVVMMIFGILSALPDVFDDSGLGIFFLLMLIGLCFLVYHLFQRMSSDYKEERRRKLK